MNKNLLISLEQLSILKAAREARVIETCSNQNSNKITFNPTVVPTVQPNVNVVFPSFKPTITPTPKHTIITPIPTSKYDYTTLEPTNIPSISSVSTSSAPTTVCSTKYPKDFVSYNKINCNDNSSTLVGTEKNDDFNLNCNGEIKIYGNGGNNKYSLFIAQQSSFTCEDFNPECDLIDLSAFSKINKFADLVMYGGPATIHLPNQQKFILNGILPSSLQEDNFIFSLNPGPEGESHPKTAFYVQNWFIATSSVAAFLVSVCTIAVITVQCIRYLYPYESSNTVIPTRPFDTLAIEDGRFMRENNPIGIALSINNIELIKHEVSKVGFDYYDNDYPIKTSWVGPNDAILVYDHNNNKQVDFAKEIVLTEWCVNAKTDFEALLCNFDYNKDKIFNKEDQEFSKFYLWQDKNQDGISQNGELTGLEEAGIVAIDFNTQEEIQDELRELGALNKAEVLWVDEKVTYAYDLVFTHDAV